MQQNSCTNRKQIESLWYQTALTSLVGIDDSKTHHIKYLSARVEAFEELGLIWEGDYPTFAPALSHTLVERVLADWLSRVEAKDIFIETVANAGDFQ